MEDKGWIKRCEKAIDHTDYSSKGKLTGVFLAYWHRLSPSDVEELHLKDWRETEWFRLKDKERL